MCLNSISETQMDALQGYKTNSEEFPLWNSAEYQSLINYDIASMKVPVQLTQAELDMVYETEELIDKLRAEGSAKVQKEMGSTTIAFFDFANMGTFQGLVYIIAIGAILGYVVSILLKAV